MCSEAGNCNNSDNACMLQKCNWQLPGPPCVGREQERQRSIPRQPAQPYMQETMPNDANDIPLCEPSQPCSAPAARALCMGPPLAASRDTSGYRSHRPSKPTPTPHSEYRPNLRDAVFCAWNKTHKSLYEMSHMQCR